MKTLLVAVLASVLLLSAPSMANAASCRGVDAARSTDGGRQVTVKFLNRTARTLIAYWINTKGKWVEYTRIRSGSSWTVDTYVGHPWVFVVASSGRCADLFHPLDKSKSHTISGLF